MQRGVGGGERDSLQTRRGGIGKVTHKCCTTRQHTQQTKQREGERGSNGPSDTPMPLTTLATCPTSDCVCVEVPPPDWRTWYMARSVQSVQGRVPAYPLSVCAEVSAGVGRVRKSRNGVKMRGGSALVRMSATCSPVGIHLRAIRPARISSRIK